MIMRGKPQETHFDGGNPSFRLTHNPREEHQALRNLSLHMKSQLQSIYITWIQRIKLEEEQRRAPLRKSKKNQPARYAQIRHSICLQESPGERRAEDGGPGKGKGMGGSETTDES